MSAMETTEIPNAPATVPIAGDATKNATPPTPSVRSSPGPSSTEVLITEQQVMFSTAAAAASRPENRLMAVLCRVFATPTAESRSQRQRALQRRMYYIESARMEREMDRL
jgi:hypothetical protein